MYCHIERLWFIGKRMGCANLLLPLYKSRGCLIALVDHMRLGVAEVRSESLAIVAQAEQSASEVGFKLSNGDIHKNRCIGRFARASFNKWVERQRPRWIVEAQQAVAFIRAEAEKLRVG